MPQIDIPVEDLMLVASALHGFTDNKSTKDEKIAFVSTVLNRLDSGRSEFGIDGNAPQGVYDVLYSNKSPYYETSGNNERFNNASTGNIQPYNEKQWKENIQITSGVMKGYIPRVKGEFIYKPQEVRKLKKTKKHNFSLTPKTGEFGRYQTFAYPPSPE